MTASAWTDDRIGRLKTLWLEGQTAEQIARALAHGITRNAVLGKVHRLGLSSGRIPAAPPPKAARPRPRCELGPVVQGALAPETAAETGHATLLSVGRHQCRWPLGDPGDPDFSLCGRQVTRGVYCAPHGERAYRLGRETPQTLERLAKLN